MPELGTEQARRAVSECCWGRGRQPYSTASLAGTRAASSAWQPPLGFLLWLSQAGFHPLIHQNKRVCREERGSHYNLKGCCVNLSIAVFCSVALSSMSLVFPTLGLRDISALLHPPFFFFIVFSKQKEAWNISPHASWKCYLQNYTTALSKIKYGLRQDQRLGVFVFPSGCKILPNGNAYLFLKWKSSPLALPLTLPKRVTKKGHKWAIVLKLQLQILPVKLLKYLHH